MAASRLLRPTSRLISKSHCSLNIRPRLSPVAAGLPTLSARRNYATPSGVKEVQVREALNDAMVEEMEADPNVFLLGEEVAQYQGA